MGRPSQYRREYPKLASELRLLGYADQELARVFRVSPATICAWKKEHSEFAEALVAAIERRTRDARRTGTRQSRS